VRVRVPVCAVDASEDSMESSEEMLTPRAGGSEVEEEERKAAADVPVERADQVLGKGDTVAGDAGEEVMVDALLPESSGQASQGKDDAEVEVHAVLQEPEVTEAPVVEVPEVKREVAKVHAVHEPEPKVDEAVVIEESSAPPVVQEQEVKGGNVVVKDSTEVSQSREVDVHTTEVNDFCDYSSFSIPPPYDLKCEF
jgi:hypothetical protein